MKKSKRSLPKMSLTQFKGAAMFGPAPLIAGENAADYNKLLARFSGAVKPTDFFEEMWVRDVVNHVWEILRLRRLQASLLQSTAHEGLKKVLWSLLGGPAAGNLSIAWIRRERDAIKEVKALLKSAGWTMDAVMAQTLVCNIDTFERFDRMIMTLENRRDNILREIDRHRATLGQKMRRAIENIEDAEFEDVTPKPVEQKGAA